MDLRNKAYSLKQKLQNKKSPKIIFVHVPKCGGSSIYKAISRSLGLKFPDGHLDPVWSRTLVGEIYNHPEAELSPELQVFRCALMTKHIKDRKHFIAGHFTVNSTLLQKMKAEYKTVTLLRTPEKRLFSHFKYWMLTRNLATDKDAVFKHWNDYINSDRAKFQANLLAVYFGESNFQEINEATVERAHQNLKQIDVVGDLDTINSFEEELTQLIGNRTTIGFENTSKNLMSDDVLKDAYIQLYKDNFKQIEEMVKTDAVIYKTFFNKS